MDQQIRLSALGRDVRVGDIYNYFTDDILHLNRDQVADEFIERKPTLETIRSFFFQKPEKFKHIMLGINSRQEQNIQQELLNVNDLWFADYLKPMNNTKEKDVAQVTVFFKIVKRTETLNQHFINSKLYDYQLNSGGKATHIVEQVVYGAEFICTMWRVVDQLRETKESADESIYRAAKAYFDRANWTNNEPELDNVNCTILSSLEAGNVSNGSVGQFITKIMNVSKTDECRPIEIALRYIPEQMDIHRQLDTINDSKLKTEHDWYLISKESYRLSNHPFLDRIPQLAKIICQFRDLLKPMRSEIDKLHGKLSVTTSDPRKVLEEFKCIIDLLESLKNWLELRRHDIETICPLLIGTNLPMLDLEEIKNQTPVDGEKWAKVFVLQANYKRDYLIERLQKRFGHPQMEIRTPTFRVTHEKHRLVEISRKLQQFAEEAQSKLSNTNYYIALAPTSSAFDDGTVHTVERGVQTPPSSSSSFSVCSLFKSTLSKVRQHVFRNPNDAVVANEDADFSSVSESDDEDLLCQRKKVETPKMAQFYTDVSSSAQSKTERGQSSCLGTDEPTIGRRNLLNARRLDYKVTNESNQDAKCGLKSRKYLSSNQVDHHRSPSQPAAKAEEIDSLVAIGGTGRPQMEGKYPYHPTRPEHPSSTRIAEMFTNADCAYSQLIKPGKPNLYLLNANQKLACPDFQWFDIGRPNTTWSNAPNHKVIILMGATGSGKSTLIDGMVNYILGVKWGDNFRFKCIREDESAVRNQALSQTSSVMAYTIHHQEGMAVPYSITIIDTPGYGDTRGVARDKEITKKIHQFLTQQETQVDEIHAACFVAASGNSRLTATQGYILDSVLAIFGKDFKDNIRLLVTFADNADPPVVEACRVANFPTASPSAAIAYNKFNSSVLYASNGQEEEFSFDELFWDMGQESFQNFFTMLGGMNGRSLKSTREVIQHRHVLQQSLRNIERELEICLVKVENMEIFRRKMSLYDHKNCVVEKAEIRFVQVKCEEGLLAYNCLRCQKTCGVGVKEVGDINRRPTCREQMCQCEDFEHAFQQVKWQASVVTSRTTLLDMKAEYESMYGRTMTNQQLLAECLKDLEMTKSKIISLLKQVGASARSLDSNALRSNALSPADYLSLMRSRVAEEQAPGYLTRLETLAELQQRLAAEASPIRPTPASTMPNSFQPTTPQASEANAKSRGYKQISPRISPRISPYSVSDSVPTAQPNYSGPIRRSVRGKTSINAVQTVQSNLSGGRPRRY